MATVGKRTPQYKLAINLVDLDNIEDGMRHKLFVDREGKERIDRSRTVHVELDRIQPTMAVVFTCDLLTAALVIDLVRSECRKHKQELVRAYINKGGESWTRLLNRLVLTVMDENNKAKLNPEVFREDTPPEPTEPVVPLEPERMF